MGRHYNYDDEYGSAYYPKKKKTILYTAKITAFLAGGTNAAKAEISRGGVVIARFTNDGVNPKVMFESDAEADIMDAEAVRRSSGGWVYDTELNTQTWSALGNVVTAEEIVSDLIVAAVVEERTKRLCKKYIVWKPESRPDGCYRILKFMSSVPKKDQIALVEKRHPRAHIYNKTYVEAEAA